ncbi:Sensor histidine kinase RcsC [Alphaproteobacteria bacterium SO-S41]|nr:Sensor histidine kinase RcsC [Alphaproteobacteria bacterium SO-S41]
MKPQTPAQAERLRTDMMAELARSTLRELPMMPVAAVALGTLGGMFVSGAVAVVWASTMLLSCVSLWVTSRRFLGSGAGNGPSLLNGRLLIAASIFQGVTTAGFTVVFWQAGVAEWNLMMLMIVMVSTILGVSLTATSIPTTASLIVIYLAVTLSLCLTEGGQVFNALAALSPIFLGVVVGSAYRAHTRVRGLLVLGYERDALIDRLQTADRTKSSFMAHMSHELRTPLNAILGFSEVMKDEVLGPMQNRVYKSYAGDIHTSGQHLLGLVNDILDLAKIEAGKLELTDDRFTMDAIVDTAFALFRVQAQKRGVALVKDVDPAVAVRWDLRAAKQIALNLMSNALKFTPAGGTIFASSRLAADGGAWVTVRDTGCGVAPEDQARIFESFGQGRHDVVGDQSTGLGLAIVKSLVEYHGGTVTLESAVGDGAAFTIHVPASRVVPAEQAAGAVDLGQRAA